MTRPRLERYRKTFLCYFDDYVLAAEFDTQQNLVVYTTPYQDFDQLVNKVCEGLIDTVDFSDHLCLYLYPFGSNPVRENRDQLKIRNSFSSNNLRNTTRK